MGHTNGLRVMICVAQVPSMTCKKTLPFHQFSVILADPYRMPEDLWTLPKFTNQNGSEWLPISIDQSDSPHAPKFPPAIRSKYEASGRLGVLGTGCNGSSHPLHPTTVCGAKVSEQHPDTPSMLIAHDITWLYHIVRVPIQCSDLFQATTLELGRIPRLGIPIRDIRSARPS